MSRKLAVSTNKLFLSIYLSKNCSDSRLGLYTYSGHTVLADFPTFTERQTLENFRYNLLKKSPPPPFFKGLVA